MGTVITFPDGSSLSSTALTDDGIQQALQVATAQMLGIVAMPLNLNVTTIVGQSVAQVDSVNLLYVGELITATCFPDGTLILSVGPGPRISVSNNATVNGTSPAVVTDPNVYAKVRIGWQQQGQPGPDINVDTATIMCYPKDTEFSRLRDAVYSDGPNLTSNMTDVFTRTWKICWTFYGSNSLDHARAVRSALITVPYFDVLLAESNLYVNPSIEEPQRVPELFQGEWWERVDLMAEFNEQVTEVFTVGTVATVPVTIYTDDGQSVAFTVTTD